jgi:hypothetical protein
MASVDDKYNVQLLTELQARIEKQEELGTSFNFLCNWLDSQSNLFSPSNQADSSSSSQASESVVQVDVISVQLFEHAAVQEVRQACIEAAFQVWNNTDEKDILRADAHYVLVKAFKLTLEHHKMVLSHRNQLAYCNMLMYSQSAQCDVTLHLLQLCKLAGPLKCVSFMTSGQMMQTILLSTTPPQPCQGDVDAEIVRRRQMIFKRCCVLLGLCRTSDPDVSEADRYDGIIALLQFIIVNDRWHQAIGSSVVTDVSTTG